MDPNSIRREKDGRELTPLPQQREGDPPAWPLAPAATARERVLWAGEWQLPQAVMWESQHREIEVALFVRTLREAERPGAKITLRTLVKQQMELLGLTPDGAVRNGWALPAAPQLEAERATGTTGRAAARWKPEVIDGGG